MSETVVVPVCRVMAIQPSVEVYKGFAFTYDDYIALDYFENTRNYISQSAPI